MFGFEYLHTLFARKDCNQCAGEADFNDAVTGLPGAPFQTGSSFALFLLGLPSGGQFRSEIHGLVVYDEKVPATSNAASTVAGADDLLCVRYDSGPDSLYSWLAGSRGPQLPVKVWLIRQDGSSLFTGQGVIPGTKTASTGSAKCDAYIWAKENYLDTGRSNPLHMGYYLDAWWLRTPQGYIPDHKLSNHDYFIAQRGFFFDLSPWGGEAPNDDPHQPVGTDLKTMQAILHSAWMQSKGQEMIHIGGFPPVPRKYTKKQGGQHEGVPTE